MSKTYQDYLIELIKRDKLAGTSYAENILILLDEDIDRDELRLKQLIDRRTYLWNRLIDKGLIKL